MHDFHRDKVSLDTFQDKHMQDLIHNLFNVVMSMREIPEASNMSAEAEEIYAEPHIETDLVDNRVYMDINNLQYALHSQACITLSAMMQIIDECNKHTFGE